MNDASPRSHEHDDTPGYPASWEFDGLLSDGHAALVRPVRPSDATALVGLHVHPQSGASPRIFATHPSLLASEMSHFATVDYRDRMAFVVIAEDRVVAFASFDRLDHEPVAQIAFVVDDSFQRRGIATLLFESLAAYAHAMGIERFVADVLEQNTNMLNILTSTGLRSTNVNHDGTVRIEIDLRPTAKYREQCDSVRRARRSRVPRRYCARARSPWWVRDASEAALATKSCARSSPATSPAQSTPSTPRPAPSAASRRSPRCR